MPYEAGHLAAVQTLTEGLLRLGLLKGTLEKNLSEGLYQRFYRHKTGHWIGMDVHDVGAYRDPASHADPRPWRTLAPGMVLTIEPGIYVRPGPDVPEPFWNIGIRIEDDAVITKGGCELITRGVPVKPDDIEALMRDHIPLGIQPGK